MTTAQINKLGERLRKKGLDHDALIALAAFRNEFIPCTNAVAKAVSERTKFKADVTQRPAKSTSSIIAKLVRQKTRLSQIQDIGGLRLVVSKVSLQDRAIRLIQTIYPDARVVDYRQNPQNGYRAVHVIVKHQNCFIEIQVRTRLQNGWAQYSEKLADLYNPAIKYGSGPQEQLRHLEDLSGRVGRLEQLEVQLDAYKRREMNHLRFKQRSHLPMTAKETRALTGYDRLLRQKREAKAQWLRYFREVAAG